jgi:hypothetical protein
VARYVPPPTTRAMLLPGVPRCRSLAFDVWIGPATEGGEGWSRPDQFVQTRIRPISFLTSMEGVAVLQVPARRGQASRVPGFWCTFQAHCPTSRGKSGRKPLARPQPHNDVDRATVKGGGCWIVVGITIGTQKSAAAPAVNAVTERGIEPGGLRTSADRQDVVEPQAGKNRQSRSRHPGPHGSCGRVPCPN